MKSVAKLTNLRISPRKVGIVLDLIRGKDVDLALAILRHTSKSASEPLMKLLSSAISNAENNHDMDTSDCYVSECYCGPGITMKRMLCGPKGRGMRILKRTSNVTIVISEAEDSFDDSDELAVESE
jgi:large subunit ribosomal protein L22